MPYIKVNFDTLSSASSELQRIARRVSDIEEDFGRTARKLDWEIRDEGSLNRRIDSISQSLQEHYHKLDKMYLFMLTAKKEYLTADGRDIKLGDVVQAGFNGISAFGDNLRDYVQDRASEFADNAEQGIRTAGSFLKDVSESYVELQQKKIELFKNLGEKFVDGCKTGAQKLNTGLSNCWSAIKTDWEAKGTSYRVVMSCKAVLDIAVGVSKIVCMVGGTAATAGLGAPLTAIYGAYAVNDVIKGLADLWNAASGNVENIGQVDPLKGILSAAGGVAGKVLGNEDGGKNVGEFLYNTGDIACTVIDVKSIMTKAAASPDAGKSFVESVSYTKERLVGATQEIGTIVKTHGSNVSGIVESLAKAPMVQSLAKDGSIIASGVEEGKKLIDGVITTVNDIADYELVQEPLYIKNATEAQKNFFYIPDSLEALGKGATTFATIVNNS